MSLVLIIDDDEMILKAMRQLLATGGHEVIQTADGPQGLQIYQQVHPDVVLLDLGLPTMDGLEVLRQLREIDKTAAVIVVTGYASEHTRKEAAVLGAYTLLDKGPDLDRLESEIVNAAARRGQSPTLDAADGTQ